MGLWHVSEGSYELPPSARRSQPILRHAPKQEQQEEEQQEQAEGSADAKPGEGRQQEITAAVVWAMLWCMTAGAAEAAEAGGAILPCMLPTLPSRSRHGRGDRVA